VRYPARHRVNGCRCASSGRIDELRAEPVPALKAMLAALASRRCRCWRLARRPAIAKVRRSRSRNAVDGFDYLDDGGNIGLRATERA
jgi:hypothetical protein